MSAGTQSRAVPPAEMRRDSEAVLYANPSDNLLWLENERTAEASRREEEFAVNNMIAANIHAKRATHFASCITELKALREINEHMTTVLRNRVLIALQSAERPPWKATHRHYKGTLYRVTGTRNNAEGEELIEGVEYDDLLGNRYFLNRERFESRIESGKPRYQTLYPHLREEDR